MKYSEKPSYNQIIELVKNAIKKLYINDEILFLGTNIDNVVSERCLMFHIGWYMLDSMKINPDFKEYNIDCEYNRNFHHPKSMYKQTENQIKVKVKDAIPDIIIHK
ncbi:MAG: hypothetical protein K2M17_01280, partial [Bacilli bacterium]|nr:hypothetical protein [Bacilli bacterium]